MEPRFGDEYEQPRGDFGAQDPMGPDPTQAKSNPLGIIGFVLSILCVTSPIGLIVSLFALRKEPRGMAIAGTIVGVLFSALLGLVVAMIVIYGSLFTKTTELATDMQRLRPALNQHNQSQGSYPADLSALGLPSDATTDPWGNPYRYERADDGTYTLFASGFDGQQNTSDDLEFTSGMTDQEVQQEIADAMEAEIQSGAGGGAPQQPSQSGGSTSPDDSPDGEGQQDDAPAPEDGDGDPGNGGSGDEQPAGGG